MDIITYENYLSTVHCTCIDFAGDDPQCPEHGDYYEQCGCVLPEQSCRACRATARNQSEWSFE